MNCWDKFLENRRRDKVEISKTPWYDIARKEIGVKEIKGSKHNPRILEYHQETTLKATTDEVPWCASFVCWCLHMAGLRSTRSAAARSFLKLPDSTIIKLSAAVTGDIVILKRGTSSWQGHVGFYVSHTSTHVKLVGGNQSDMVNESSYRVSDLLGIRRPIL